MATTDYFIFSPLDYESENLQKTYDVFNLVGGQAGLDLSFYHKGFSIGLQPTFKIMRLHSVVTQKTDIGADSVR